MPHLASVFTSAVVVTLASTLTVISPTSLTAAQDSLATSSERMASQDAAPAPAPAPAPAQTQATPPPAQPAQTPAPTPAPAVPTQQPPDRKRGQNVNVRLDITIADQSGSNTPVTKSLNIVVADMESGAIRSTVHVPRRIGSGPVISWETQELPLNIDVRPELMEANRVKVRLVLNYRTMTAPGLDNEPPRRSEVTETVTLVLDSGKPAIVSQSADAASDRKVTVELKATILR